MKQSLYILIIISMVFGSLTAQQGFKGTLIAGLNLAQLDGDLLAGYDKPGLSAGARLTYDIKKEVGLHMELLYSARGSQEQLFGDNISRTHLQYIEIPVLVSYGDWYIEDEGYHKVRAEVGLSYGYLFDVTSDNPSYQQGVNDLREGDISYILGVGYNFTSSVGMSLRYTRSFIDLYRPDSATLRSYFLTLRGEYTF